MMGTMTALGRLAAGALMLGAGLFGLGAPASAETALTMQAGSSAPSAVYIPVYIAQKVGFFKEEGLDVTMRYGNGGPLAAQLVANGDADIAHIVYDPVILGHDRGIKGKFFYQTYTKLMYYLAVQPNSPIKTAADLRGKKVGVFNVGSAAVHVTKSMAEMAGVPADQVTIVPVGVGPQALAALTTGRVDALALWDAVYATYEATGHHLRYLYHPTLKDDGNGGFFASDATIAKKAAALEGFSRAIAKATVFLLANPTAATEIYWQVNPSAKIGSDRAAALKRTATELEFVGETFDVSKRPGHQFGAFITSQVQAHIGFLKSTGQAKANVTVQDITTNRFVKAANDFDVAKVRAFAKAWKPQS
jgi:NitT/TauT family transport system substrate-binding protein